VRSGRGMRKTWAEGHKYREKKAHRIAVPARIKMNARIKMMTKMMNDARIKMMIKMMNDARIKMKGETRQGNQCRRDTPFRQGKPVPSPPCQLGLSMTISLMTISHSPTRWEESYFKTPP